MQNLNNLNTRIEGSGPPAIFLHGLGGSLDEWTATNSTLLDAGFQTYRVDLPGHGQSYKPADVQNYQSDYVFDEVEEWFLGLDIKEPPVLIAHSFGAYLALSLVLRHPESVRQLVLISPFLYTDQLLPLMKMTVRQPDVASKLLEMTPNRAVETVISLASAVNNNLPAEAVRQSARDLMRASPNIVYIAPSIQDMRPKISEIYLPTLVVWGGKDLTLNPASFSDLEQAFPNSIAKSYAESGHAPHLSDVEPFSEILLSFLTQATNI